MARLHRQQQVEALLAHALRLARVGLLRPEERVGGDARLGRRPRVGLQQRLRRAALAAEDLAALAAVVLTLEEIELALTHCAV